MYDRNVPYTRNDGNYDLKLAAAKLYIFFLRRHIDVNDADASSKWRMEKMNDISSTIPGHAVINALIHHIEERTPKLHDKLAKMYAFPGIPKDQYDKLAAKEKKRFEGNIVIVDGAQDSLIYYKDIKAIRMAEHELMMAPKLKKELKEVSEFWDIKHSTCADHSEVNKQRAPLWG